jgi:hypothetical protein
LLEKLRAHPEIRERLEGMLLAVLDEEEVGNADAAELRLIDEMRQMGHASLSAWAQRKAERETVRWQAHAGVCREGKKTLLAHDIRRHKRRRSPATRGQTPAASLGGRSEGSSPGYLRSPTTG